ncbi:MAG TPA: TonB family protein [Firmicutes bacterium]|nr:TonB family protein [Bacillota bacterium]
MRYLRQKDNFRSVTSFLIALLLHALLLLLPNGAWGQRSKELQVIRVYSRLVEVENTRSIERKPTSTPKVEERAATTDLSNNATEKTISSKAKIEEESRPTEVTQKKPAPRQAPPAEQKEPAVSPQEAVKPEPEAASAEVEEEASAKPAPPPLPPLGNGRGMLMVNHTSYPKDLLNKGIEGVVRIRIFINEEGTLAKEPELIMSSGHIKLDEHCLLTIKRLWKFKPAPKPYQLSVELSFTNDEVEGPRFLEETTYLSPEEGGTSE